MSAAMTKIRTEGATIAGLAQALHGAALSSVSDAICAAAANFRIFQARRPPEHNHPSPHHRASRLPLRL